jgi:hypothetical protein
MGPTFLVIGAGRSGTTSLHEYLAEHPQVFVCAEKSPNFFVADDPLPEWEGPHLRAMARQWVSDARAYEALFAGAGTALARGDVSPVYLQSLNAPGRIHARYPDVKIVAILREPVERAYAHYMGRRRDGLETRANFGDAVADERARPIPDVVAFGSYLGCGRYHHFLRPYYERFPRDHIRVYLYEDLARDARALMRDLFAFIGVDPVFEPDMTRRRGQTGLVGHPLARLLWTKSVSLRTAIRPWLPRSLRDRAAPVIFRQLERPPIDPAIREELRPLFADDIRRLQGLIARDLSHWLDKEEKDGVRS